jgi:small subunit ribosomal protein S4
VRRIYGILEDQFRRYFFMADRKKGVTGENLLQLLERRLDNTIYRLGFANSRNHARQLVRHNHVQVNGKKVNIPSYLVEVGEEIALKEKSQKNPAVNESIGAVARRGVPSWLTADHTAYKGTVKTMPVRAELTLPIQEQLIVELYSK